MGRQYRRTSGYWHPKLRYVNVFRGPRFCGLKILPIPVFRYMLQAAALFVRVVLRQERFCTWLAWPSLAVGCLSHVRACREMLIWDPWSANHQCPEARKMLLI